MNKLNKFIPAIAIIALLLSGYSAIRLLPIRGNGGQLGAAGNLLAENYIPYVLYNGGYNSAKDFSISGSSAFSGASTFSGAVALTSTFTLGSAGSSQTQQNRGLCYIYPYTATIFASSTVQVDCQATAAAGTAGAIAALPGVQANDYVQATLSTTTQGTIATGTGGLVLAGASASTTAGYITLRITNLTGAAFTWPTTGAATGTAYYWSSR